MDERYLSDLINCDIEDKEKMIEAVKEKLRWYTFEASEEEFDPEAVDMLVRFLQDAEPELGKVTGNEDAKDKVCDKGELEQKKRVIPFKRGKIAAAVVIGILTLTLASVIVGNSLGDSLAWENGGFFRWLQRDKDGQTMITSPEDLGMEDGNVTYYEKISDVPEEYLKFLIGATEIEESGDERITVISIENEDAFRKVSETLFLSEDKEIKLGVMIFQGKVRVIRESYDSYEYQYSKEVEGYFLDFFSKSNIDGKREYTVFFYDDNIKYYVTSELDFAIIENVAEKYIKCKVK